MDDIILYRQLGAAIERREAVALITVTKSRMSRPVDRLETASKMLVFADGRSAGGEHWPDEFSEQAKRHALEALAGRRSGTYAYRESEQEDEIEYYIESHPAPPHLVVAGAGHVAKPVIELAHTVGFRTTVLCDRPQYADPKQFPLADEVICAPYLDYFRRPEHVDGKYVLLLTRGHQFDVMILREILYSSAAYIGMIGSRRRISGVFSQLRAESPDASFDHVYAPVGLDLGAETPEEIAVSIMAEIMMIRSGGTGRPKRSTVGHFIAERK